MRDAGLFEGRSALILVLLFSLGQASDRVRTGFRWVITPHRASLIQAARPCDPSFPQRNPGKARRMRMQKRG
jgi:hypothetical protein